MAINPIQSQNFTSNKECTLDENFLKKKVDRGFCLNKQTSNRSVAN